MRTHNFKQCFELTSAQFLTHNSNPQLVRTHNFKVCLRVVLRTTLLRSTYTQLQELFENTVAVAFFGSKK